jgi:hypothetical protein
MRLWRARKRHDHIDAVLSHGTSNVDHPWTLEYLRNDTPFLVWRYPDRESAQAEADGRLQELLRAGWNSHW